MASADKAAAKTAKAAEEVEAEEAMHEVTLHAPMHRAMPTRAESP